MSYIKIKPKKLKGEVNIPPSKSMAHRAVICASLSKGTSIIDNVDFSDDIIATINAMKALGATIDITGNRLIINGENIFANLDEDILIDCNESGSTLRFLVPISIIKNNRVNFIGRGNLGKRPLNIYYDIFNEQGIFYKYEEEELDLKISGKLKGGEFKVKGNISSQFISGLLFSLPMLEENSKIIITTELESKAYIDLTLSMLEKFGIEIINNDYEEFIIKGNQEYKAREYRVEGDYSQAAFFLSAAAIGNDVLSKDIDLASLQGDKEVLEILERMGCNLNITEEGVKVETETLKPTVIDGSSCPDIIPVLTVVAALTKGETKVINAGRLRIKECDRLRAVTTELSKLGANIVELEDGLTINGVDEFKGATVDSYDDHRIAMMLAIASTRCDGEVILKNHSCVSKSYPNFWQDFIKVGGEVSEWSMGE